MTFNSAAGAEEAGCRMAGPGLICVGKQRLPTAFLSLALRPKGIEVTPIVVKSISLEY